MKNFINYYYNFDIHNMTLNDGKYFFYNKKNKYMLKQYENIALLTDYIELWKNLSNYNYFFSIVLNNENNYITWIENKPYILLKISNIRDDEISIFDIKPNLYINRNIKSSLNYFNWIKLWENKIDYFEELFEQKKEQYKSIYPLFNYFIGIAENALLYLKESEKIVRKENDEQLVISHVRISTNYSLYDYYDPTKIIIDHPSRDISEYIKSSFVNKEFDLEVFKDYLKKNEYSQYGLRIMLARIIFPSYFFDYIELMIINNKNIDILYLENRINEFQNFLKQIIILFNEEYDIPVIPWIIKKHK